MNKKEKSDYSIYDMTQAEVSKEIGISREHLGSIEKRAMQKVKEELERRGIDLKTFFKD
jgi:DNA-binding XRE family transcriptional regulator